MRVTSRFRWVFGLQGFDLAVISPELHARLEADWDVASKQVAHLSIDKTAPVDAPLVKFVDAVRLRRHTSDLFEAMRAFVQLPGRQGEPVHR